MTAVTQIGIQEIWSAYTKKVTNPELKLNPEVMEYINWALRVLESFCCNL